MKTTINATAKGAITGILMAAIGILLYIREVPLSSRLQYAGYVLYLLGIVWTVASYSRQAPAARFGALFQQGFRCFIVVTLVMSVFTFAFYKASPGLIEKDIAAAKSERLKTARDRTPAEIEEEATATRKYYIPLQVSQTIFQYIITGAIITAVTAGFLSLSKKN